MTDEFTYMSVSRPTLAARLRALRLQLRARRLQELLDSATDEERAEYEREMAKAQNELVDRIDRAFTDIELNLLRGTPGLPHPRM